MADSAILVEGLSKNYHIGARPVAYHTLREHLTTAAGRPLRRLRAVLRGHPGAAADLEAPFAALTDVSFTVPRGSVVGIIGRNGAGKSTLLKILARITAPTRGRVVLAGRLGALLDVGTGFHPELTGRENIYLNGAILGMGHAEITAKLDEIVAFAGLATFLETPVKHYSSGMAVRLGFAIAAHIEPDILVLDEVLAVGDTVFQQKCLGKIGEVAGHGRTVLFVSHNLSAVAALCEHGLLLHQGRLTAAGSMTSVLHTYMAMGVGTSRLPLHARTDRRGSGRLRFTDWALVNGTGEVTATATTGEPLTVVLAYAGVGAVRNVDAFIAVRSTLGALLFVCHVGLSRGLFPWVPPVGQLRCFLPHVPLLPGHYRFSMEMRSAPDQVLDSFEDVDALVVEPGTFYATGTSPSRWYRDAVLVEHHWDAVERTDDGAP
jgi:lipopolysaccharide transport system ATP-binding protein